jgi:hypothetical protein
MFERSEPIRPDENGGETRGNPSIRKVESRAAFAVDALRAIEWSELTARLNAARDLRLELREEAAMCAHTSGASFGDAAANFFKTLGQDERPVNPDDLEGRKGSCGTVDTSTMAAATGDARNKL